MKKITKITSLLAAAAMTFTMSATLNASADEKTADAQARETAYDELYERSKTFSADDSVFTEKYKSAAERIENDPSAFDLSTTRPYNGAEINYDDYQCIRDYINELYSKDGFKKHSFTMEDGADYNRIRCDVDGDGELSYYDYCSVLRYSQEQLGITADYTDFTNTTENGKLSIDVGEGWISIKKGALVSDKTDITLPSELCVKIRIKKSRNNSLPENELWGDAWCILPVAYVEEGAFDNCENMTSLTIRNYIQPKWFRMIEEFNCEEELYGAKGGLVPIATGGTVAVSTFINLNDGAFRNCPNLTTVNFQENINFTQYVFSGTKFGSSTDNIWVEGNGITYVKSSDDQALVACGADASTSLVLRDGIYNLDIAEGTTTITNQVRNAFNPQNSDKQVSVNIPKTVKYIHNDAFSSYEGLFDCSNIKWVNGKTYNELGVASAAQSDQYDQKKLDEILKEEKELQTFLANNNGSFKFTDFMYAPVRDIIEAKAAEINSTCSTEEAKVNAVCRYIFNKADYTSFVGGTEDFALFPNGDYNTFDISRQNIYSATNTFLTDHTECESYSMAVSLLLEKLGIRNYMLGCEGHAFNCVFYGEKWHLIDMSAYGSYNCNEELYDRIAEETGDKFVKDKMNVKYRKWHSMSGVHYDNFNLFYMEPWYPQVTIAGKSKVRPFNQNNMINYDVGFNIVSIAPGQSSMEVALPGDENLLPQPIKDDIAAGRIKVYEANGIELINGSYYYYVDNKMVANEGWINIDGKQCYIKKNGALAHNEDVEIEENGKKRTFRFGDDFNKVNGLYISDGYVRYCDPDNGSLTNGSIYVNDKFCQFDEEGKLINITGLLNIGDNLCYIKNDGTLARNENIELFANGKNRVFRFGDDCFQVNGLYIDNGYVYCCDSYCGVIKDGCNFKNGKYCTYDTDGKLNNITGWFNDGGKLCYIKNNRKLACDEVLNIYENGETVSYKFTSNYAGLSGWESSNNVYYFYKDGRMMKNTFVKIYDEYYHFNSEGVMSAGTNVEWNGTELSADPNGAIDLSGLNENEKADFENGAIVY